MTFIRRFAQNVSHQRGWLWALLGINFVGSLYGFWWYRYQLMESPRWQWIIIPDSPGSTFLFFIWLALVLGGIDWRKPGMQWLAAVAFVSNMKYGFWTSTVLPYAGVKLGWELDYVYLSLSHLGMAIQAFIFARYYKPALAPAVGALLWMWFQDLIDYKVLMTFPRLPDISIFDFARNMAVALSTIWGAFLVLQAAAARKLAAR